MLHLMNSPSSREAGWLRGRRAAALMLPEHHETAHSGSVCKKRVKSELSPFLPTRPLQGEDYARRWPADTASTVKDAVGVHPGLYAVWVAVALHPLLPDATNAPLCARMPLSPLPSPQHHIRPKPHHLSSQPLLHQKSHYG